MRIVFVGTGELINRLPETLSQPGREIIVVGPKNCSLRHSEYVSKFVELMPVEPLETWQATVLARYEQILELKADWVIIADDETVGAIARSNIPVQDKLALLPTKSAEGIALLGTKVGLADAMNRLPIIQPRSVTAQSHAQSEALTASFDTDYLIKGDLFGGGSRVRKFAPGQLVEGIPADWYPVVLQEFIPGREISVEALFKHGRLVAWLYSEAIVNLHVYGPSSVRLYREPPAIDFETTLNIVGQDAELHGLFNCAFIWSEDRAQHYLFELDPRPNAWHQFGKHFGVDWVSALSSENSDSLIQHPKGPAELIRLYPRDLKRALSASSWQGLKTWVFGEPGTWDTRNRLDKAVNRYDRRIVLFWFATPIISLGAKMWQSLPTKLQRFLVKTGVKRAVIFLVGA